MLNFDAQCPCTGHHTRAGLWWATLGLEFGNSWKFSRQFDALPPQGPLHRLNLHRRSWAQKQCSIINSHLQPATPTYAGLLRAPGEGGMEVALGSPPPSEASCGRKEDPVLQGETGPGDCRSPGAPRCLKPFSPAEPARYLRGLRELTPAPATGATVSASGTAVAAYAQACHACRCACPGGPRTPASESSRTCLPVVAWGAGGSHESWAESGRERRQE